MLNFLKISYFRYGECQRPIYTFEDKAEIEVHLIKSHIPYSEEKLAKVDVDNYSNIEELSEDILPW